MHIWKDGKDRKIWMESGSVAFNRGYSAADIRALVAVVRQQSVTLREIWNEQFGR